MYFEIIGPLIDIEVIAVGRSIRELPRLRRRYGRGRWRKLKGVTATRDKKRFGICLQNQGCEDLEVGKIYRILPDKAAAAEGHLRVIDESGEDYLYPAEYFVFVELPPKVKRVLSAPRAKRIRIT